MTEELTAQQKRQDILQKMRERRGETRQTGEEQPQTGLEADSFMDTFQRLRNMKAAISKGGGDIASQISQLDANDPLMGTLMKLRDARKNKKAGGDGGDDKDPIVQAFLNRRRKKNDGQQEAGKKALSPSAVQHMQQNFSATSEADLSASSLDELRQRRQEVQYRQDWLTGLLAQTQQELDALDVQISARVK